MLTPYIPYIIVVFLGALVGIAEVIATFSEAPRDAFRTYWAWILVALNMVTAAGVFALSSFYATNTNPVILAVGVGIGLPTLIRTKFTVAKQFMGGEDLSINVGWLYDQFLNWFKSEIDISIVNTRVKIIGQLIAKIPDIEKLKGIAHTALQERSLFTQEQLASQEKFINNIVDSPSIPDGAKQVALAKFIWSMGGKEYVKNLIKG